MVIYLLNIVDWAYLVPIGLSGLGVLDLCMPTHLRKMAEHNSSHFIPGIRGPPRHLHLVEKKNLRKARAGHAYSEPYTEV
jgi:hypothetical protein